MPAPGFVRHLFSGIDQFRKRTVLLDLVQAEPPERFLLGKQGNTRPQQHRGDLYDYRVHHAGVQQRRQDGAAADGPNIFCAVKLLDKFHHIPIDKAETFLWRMVPVGKAVIIPCRVPGRKRLPLSDSVQYPALPVPDKLE